VSFEEEAGPLLRSPTDLSDGAGAAVLDDARALQRIPVSDLWLFGVHPLREPLRLTVCNICEQRVLATAFTHHVDECRVHKRKADEEDAREAAAAAAAAVAAAAKAIVDAATAKANATAAKEERAAAKLLNGSKKQRLAGGGKSNPMITAGKLTTTSMTPTPTTAAAAAAYATHTAGADIPTFVPSLAGEEFVPKGQSPLSWRDRAQLREIMHADGTTSTVSGIVGMDVFDPEAAATSMAAAAAAVANKPKSKLGGSQKSLLLKVKLPPGTAKIPKAKKVSAGNGYAEKGVKRDDPSQPTSSRRFKKRCPTVGCTGVGHRTGKFDWHFTVSGCPTAAAKA
jgi:hypothetical protein